jgi:hypothetical protein
VYISYKEGRKLVLSFERFDAKKENEERYFSTFLRKEKVVRDQQKFIIKKTPTLSCDHQSHLSREYLCLK